MRKLLRLLKKEDGAELIETVIIYPIVFLCIGFLLYLGVYILQYVTVGSYAQKVAVLAARELSHPGYISMVTDPEKSYATGSVEMDLEDYSEKNAADKYINLEADPKKVHARAYRFWSRNPIGKAGSEYAAVLTALVDNKSILKSESSAEVEITSSNYIVAQYVDVTVKQKLVNFGILEAFGVDTPVIEVSAKAAATDVDEFVRNTDLVVDTLDSLAKKLGIDISKIKEKIDAAKEKLGMKYDD